MLPSDSSSFQNEIYQNIPNMSLAFTMYTTTFGNGNSLVQAPQAGQMTDQFPTLPYTSIEAVLYNQQSSNPQSAPVNTVGGSNTGQQVISSTQTANDYTGTARLLTGNQQTP